MGEKQLAPLIHAQTAAIETLAEQIRTREAMRRVLRTVALGELSSEQAMKVLEEMAERGNKSPEHEELY